MARILVPVLCLALLLLVPACGGSGGGEEDTRVPTLTGSQPANGQAGVSPDTLVDLFWAQDLDPTTVTPAHVELRAPSGAVSGTLSYDAGARRIRFVSDAPLALGTRYIAHVSPGLATTDGQVLQAPYDVAFRIRDAASTSSNLLEIQHVDDAWFVDLALDEDGRGFAFWIRSPAVGNRTFWATAFDLATGRGAATSLGAAAILGSAAEGIEANASGDTVVTWETQNGTDDVFATVFDAGTNTWLPATQLNVTVGETARTARVGIDANGNALVVWSQQAGFGAAEDLWFRRYTTTGGWGGATRLETSAGAARGVVVDVHPNGRLCVAWHQESSAVYNIHARRYDPAFGWGAVELLETSDTTRAFAPQVAVAPNGDIVACWRQEEGAAFTDERMWANRYVAGSGWQGPALVKDDPGENRGFKLVMDANGNAIVAWQQYVNPAHHAYARHCSAAGTWGNVVTLSGTNDYTIGNLDLAVTPAGQAMATWVQAEATADVIIRARSYDPGTGWGAIAGVVQLGNITFPAPSLVLDPEANALLAWDQAVYGVGGGYLRNDAWSARYTPISGWGTPATLESDEVNSAFSRAAAMDRQGRGVAVWSERRTGAALSDLYYRVFR